MRTLSVVFTTAAIVALGAAGCGGGSSSGSSGSPAPNPNAKESSPPGDIPDNQAFVAYRPPRGGYSVKVPEGWSRIASGGAVTFTDKLNSIRMQSGSGARLTAAKARSELPQLAQTVKGFQQPRVGVVKRTAGPAVRITYVADASPNAVTGKAGKDAVERYVFFHNGKRVVLTLSGPKGADNVDPWRIVTDSLRWTG
jgi:hypothetical protein